MKAFAAALWAVVLGLVRPVGKATRVACVGDSITLGAGLRGEDTYPEALGRLLGPTFLVGNFGRGGATASKRPGGGPSYWDTLQFWLSTRFGAQIVVLMLGTNDCKPYNWKGTFERDLAELGAVYQARLYLCLPPPALLPSFDVDLAVLEDGVLPAVRRVAAAMGATLVDVHGAFAEDPDRFFVDGNGPQGDGVHPNRQGALHIARAVAACLRS